MEAISVNVLGINTLNRSLVSALPQGSSILFVGSTLSEKAVAGAFQLHCQQTCTAGDDAGNLPRSHGAGYSYRDDLPRLYRYQHAPSACWQ